MKSFAILSATAVSLVFAPNTALAQSCTEDLDCAPEDYCDLYPSSGDSSGSSGSSGDPDPGCAPGEDCGGGAPPSDGEESDSEASEGEPSDGEADEDPVPVTEEPAVGQCERGGRECTSDDECLEDHYCAFDQTDAAVTCQGGDDCSDAVATPVSSAIGRCEHNPYTCDTDADCPDPAVCGEDGECLYVLEPCETNDECSAAYECLPLRGSSTDSSSSEDSGDPGVASSDSADVAGDPLPDPGAAPNSGAEPIDDTEASEAAAAAQEAQAAQDAMAEDAEASGDVPSEDAAGICFPELVECETDTDCTDDWVCAAIDDGPPEWEDIEYACLPPGIAAVLDGDLEVEGGRGTEESGDLSGDLNEGSDGEDGDEIGTIDEDDDALDVALGTQGGSEGSAPNDSCSVAATGASHRGTSWPFLIAALGLLGLTRRSRARR